MSFWPSFNLCGIVAFFSLLWSCSLVWVKPFGSLGRTYCICLGHSEAALRSGIFSEATGDAGDKHKVFQGKEISKQG